MGRLRLVGAVIILWAGTGCTARQLGADGNQFREVVCDLYTEQAMDNLIRARTYRPFVQLVYRDLLAQTTDTAGGTLGASTDVARVTSPFDALSRTVTKGLTAGGSGSRECQLSFHADPILDRPEVYEAFVRFAHDPTLFVESDLPPPCPVHVYRQCGDRHYWVPAEAAPKFLALVLLTSFTPPGEPPVSPAHDVEIEEVAIRSSPGKDDNFYTVDLKFKDPVPKGHGTLVVSLPGLNRQVHLTIYPLPTSRPNFVKGPEGTSVNWVATNINPARDGLEHPAHLNGQKGQFFSYKFPRLVPPPAPPLGQRVYNELDRIRARQ